MSGDKKTYPQGKAVADISAETPETADTETGIRLTLRGAQWVTVVNSAGQAVSINTNTNGLNTADLAFATRSAIYGFSNNGDPPAPVKLGSFQFGNEVNTLSDTGALNALMVNATVNGYYIVSDDGTFVSGYFGDANDNITFGGLGGIFELSINYAWNGTGYDRLRTGSATNISETTQIPLLISAPGNWTLTNAPAADTTATATKTAGAAGVRHVLTSISADITAVAAIAAPLTLVVRDGATGVGTILWQRRMTAPAGTTKSIDISGLNIVGSAATAMTVEFTAAPGATNFETLSATGYSVA